VTSEQLLILGLLAAAFAAGWFARGGRAERPAGESEREADSGEADGGEAAVEPAAPQAGDDALVAEADEELRRAVTAARAARAVAVGSAGANAAATRVALGVLDHRLVALERCADRLEDARGDDDRAFAAFDRAVSGLAALRRNVEADTALDAVEAAQAEWQRATRAP